MNLTLKFNTYACMISLNPTYPLKIYRLNVTLLLSGTGTKM